MTDEKKIPTRGEDPQLAKEQEEKEKVKVEIKKKYHNVCSKYDQIRGEMMKVKNPEKYAELHKKACVCAQEKYELADQLRRA